MDTPATRKRSAILHIGVEKTGTTTIQSFLDVNRQGLLRNGCLALPVSCGLPTNTHLAVYAAPPTPGSALYHRLGVHSYADWEQFNSAFEQSLDAELAALPPHVSQVVFSCEHCHSRLRQESEIQRLASLLYRHFESVQIIVYLRRQDQLAVSRYSTFLRHGHSSSKVLREKGPDVHYFNFETLLDKWARVFGAEAIRPRLFPVSDGGDLLTDFLTTCGLCPDPLYHQPPRQNEALEIPAAWLLLQLNKLQARYPNIIMRRIRWVLMQILDARFKGGGPQIKRREAEDFLAIHAPSNEAVRHRWFPDQQSLFDSDMSKYSKSPGVFTKTMSALAFPPRFFTAAVAESIGLARRIGVELRQSDQAGIAALPLVSKDPKTVFSKKKPAQTKYLRDNLYTIVCPARSGSTMLVHLLRSHPDIWCNGEVFLRKGKVGALNGTYRHKRLEDEECMRELERERKRDLTRFLYKYVFDPQGHKLGGFKFKLDEIVQSEFSDLKQLLLDDRDIKIIYLTRENLLERYLSWHLAVNVTGKTLVTGDNAEPEIPKVSLNPKKVRNDFEETLRRQEEYRQLFDQHRVLDVTFESLTEAPRESQKVLCDFLGVPATELSTTTRKIVKNSAAQIILNYDELKDYFNGTPFSRYFE